MRFSRSWARGIRVGFVLTMVIGGCGGDDANTPPKTPATLPDGAPIGGPDGGVTVLPDGAIIGPDGAVIGPDGSVIPPNDDAGPPKPPPPGTKEFLEITKNGSGLDTVQSGMIWHFDNAIEDFDNDGKLDLFLGDHDSNNNQNRLAHNNGNNVYTSVATAGIKCASSGGVWSFIAVDFDNDGFVDALPNWDASSTSMFVNDKAGGFTNLAGSGHFDHVANGMVWGDYDGDGMLDFAVNNFGGNDKLWHRKSTGITQADFEDKSAAGMITGKTSASLYLADLNGDHWPDLIVQSLVGGTNVFDSNTGCSTKVLINKAQTGSGAGFAAPQTAGLDSAACFGIALGDYDNDGDLDVASVGSAAAGNASAGSFMVNLGMKLHRNDGTGNFSDVTAAALLPTTTTKADVYRNIYDQAVWVDLDEDGYLDLIVGLSKDQIFRNQGNRTFQDVTSSWKLNAGGGRPERFFVGDVDGDGDSDLLTMEGDNSASHPANTGFRLWRNELSNPTWLTIRAVGTKIKTALGTKIFLYEAGHVGDAGFLRGYREVMSSTSHRSPLEQNFGTETGKTYDVRVRFWPDGKVVDIANVNPGQRLKINENGTSATY